MRDEELHFLICHPSNEKLHPHFVTQVTKNNTLILSPQ